MKNRNNNLFNKSRTALIIIDIINDFNFSHGIDLAKKVNAFSDNIIALRNSFKQNNLPVIYVNDHYKLWQANLSRLLEYCTNTLSESILEKLSPEEDDYFLIKPKHSAFYGTSLVMLLRELKIDTVVLTGVAGNICVLFTANDAYMREYQIIVPRDCIASNNDHDNEFALRMMENVLKADIVMTKDLI